MIKPTSFPSVSNMKSIAGNSEIPPACLTHWPTFVSRKFPQVQLLVGEFVDPIDESTSCARSPESERSAQSRPSMVSNFPKPPPDSSPRNAGQCGRSNSVSYCCTF